MAIMHLGALSEEVSLPLPILMAHYRGSLVLSRGILLAVQVVSLETLARVLVT